MNSGSAAAWKTSVPGKVWSPIYNFAGTFDGQGHTISGLYGMANADSQIGMGLFAKTVDTTVIQNLSVTNSYFKSESLYGLSAIASRGTGTFKNIYADAILEGTGGSAGGVLGYVLGGTISVENSWSNCTITDGGRRVGGIIGNGNDQKVTIRHCLNTGTITRSGSEIESTYGFFGGIIGAAFGKVTIDDCFNSGLVTSKRVTNADMIGAIVGQSTGTVNVTNSYGTSSSCAKALGHNNNSKGTLGMTLYADNKLLGTGAYINTALDFDTYWAAIADKTPVLKSFTEAGQIFNVANLMRPDRSWFDTVKNAGTIQTMEQLYGFIQLAQNGAFNKDSVVTLGTDIVVNSGNAADWANSTPEYEWTPVYGFTGTFDGQGHTISGLYGVANVSDEIGMGLFAKTTDTTKIQNLSVENSYFKSDSEYGMGAIASRGTGTFKNIYVDVILEGKGGFAGGILGRTLEGTVTVENCWSNSTITNNGKRVGGIVGEGNGQTVTIRHCLNTGTITSTLDAYTFFGGIIGATGNTRTGGTYQQTFVIDDCLNTGLIKGTKGCGTVIGQATGKFTVNNTYALTTAGNNTIGHNNGYTGEATIIQSSENRLTGIEAYYNTTLDFDTYWSVIKNELPILKAFATKVSGETVDVSGVERVDSTAWFDTRTNSGTITTLNQFYGFVQLNQEGKFNKDSVVKLGTDITINEGNASEWGEKAPANTWTPILNFTGTFDGQGHTISGLYGVASSGDGNGTGLFSKTKNTTVIQNVRLTNSYFKAEGIRLAAISAQGMGTFKNIYTDAILVGGSNCGSIVGLVDSSAVVDIENCWSNCTITAGGQRVGGIIGNTNGQKVTVEHCLNTGSIARKGNAVNQSMAFFGGLIGAANGTVTVDDCLNTGSVTSERTNDLIGAIIGQSTGTVQVTNSYGTSSSCAKTLGHNNNGMDASGMVLCSDSALSGNNAFVNTKLDKTYWVAVEGKTPVLKTFAEDSGKTSATLNLFTALSNFFSTLKL